LNERANPAATSAELSQALNLISWLDEEHRRDRAEITRLQQRLEAQAAEMAEQARRMQELEGRIATLQAQLARLPEFNKSIEAAKRELISMIERIEEERLQAQREAARLRLADVEAQSRAISELRKKIEILPDLVDRLETRFAEDRRLSQELVSLRERLAELPKSFADWAAKAAFLEEQRAQDAKRIAQLQQEVAELFKRLEPFPGRFELVDEQLRRTAAALDELRAALPAMTEKQVQLNERYLKDRAEFTRQLVEWADKVDRFEQQLERFSKEIRTFQEAQQEAARTLERVAELDVKVQQDVHQAAEHQRLAEERLRREYQQWVEEGEKRWARHEMASAKQLAEIQASIDELRARLEQLVVRVEALYPEVERLWQTFDRYAEHRLSEAQQAAILIARVREGGA
jgi:chromosome segregation ATPase